MNHRLNEASKWRVDLARELCQPYSSHSGVIMTCLGGSAARGISDSWSDLDIIVYWDEVDEDWIRSEPLSSKGIARTAMMNTAPGCFIESYYLDNLKADFGHVRLADFREWLAPLHSDQEFDHGLIGSVGGFLSSVVFFGEDVYREVAEWIGEYPDSLALDVVKKNLGFYVKGYLDGQCWLRGDTLAYHDGMVAMLKKVLNATAALNRYWYNAGEARWAEHHLDRMEKKPDGLSWKNIRWMLENPGAEAVAILGRIQASLLDLVAKEFPDLAEKVALRMTRMESMTVKPCDSPPDLP